MPEFVARQLPEGVDDHSMPKGADRLPAFPGGTAGMGGATNSGIAANEILWFPAPIQQREFRANNNQDNDGQCAAGW